jgi:hypothetical protein
LEKSRHFFHWLEKLRFSAPVFCRWFEIFHEKLTRKAPFFRKGLTRMDLRKKYNMLWFNLTAIQHLDNFCPVAQRALSKKASYNQVINRGKILWLKQLQQKTHFLTDSANALD